MTTLQYTPPPTVKEFIKHHLPGELFADWIVGPVGSGKTTGIFFKLVYMAKLQAKSPVDGKRRSRCVIVRSTMPQLRDTTIKSFNYWFKDGQAGKWRATDNSFMLMFGDVECEVLFRPLDTPDDVQRVLSLEVTFAIIDEFVDTPKEIVEALSARCGRYPPEIDGGATNWGMWGASNPGNENDWWYPMLEDHQSLPEDQAVPDNWKYYKQPSGLSADAENIDNLPGKAAYYTNLMKGKTNHWIKQFIEVQWGYSLNGKPVFPMFNKEYHVAKGSLRYDPTMPLVAGYDPGMQSAVIIGQQDKWGSVRILAELVLEDYSTDRMISEQLKPLLARKFPKCEFLVVPDPASGNRSQASDTSVMKELKKHFAVKVDTDNKIESRLAPAQYYMMKRTSGGEGLQIDPSCIRLIRALTGGYKFTLTKGDVKKEVPDKNMHSHPADAFTYLVRYFRSGEEAAGRKVGLGSFTPPKFQNTYNMR